MKKLVLFLALGFYTTSNNISAQSIVPPVEVDVTIIEKNATDIILINRQSGDVMLFGTASEFYVAYPSLNPGIYNVRYTLDGERHKQYIKISSSVKETTALSVASSYRLN